MLICTMALSAAMTLSELPPAPQDAQATVAGEYRLAQEPVFADLVSRARALKSQVDQWIAVESQRSGPQYDLAYSAFKLEAIELSRRDLQGHLLLKERGTDGDLTCILRGISEDIPVKLEAVEASSGTQAHKLALEELAYLLNDNVEVIVAPPVAP